MCQLLHESNIVMLFLLMCFRLAALRWGTRLGSSRWEGVCVWVWVCTHLYERVRVCACVPWRVVARERGLIKTWHRSWINLLVSLVQHLASTKFVFSCKFTSPLCFDESLRIRWKKTLPGSLFQEGGGGQGISEGDGWLTSLSSSHTTWLI